MPAISCDTAPRRRSRQTGKLTGSSGLVAADGAMDRPAEGVEEGADMVTGRLHLEADGAMDRAANGVEDGAEMVTGRHYLEADGAMDRPAYGVEGGAQVVTGRHRLEAGGADGSVQAVPKLAAALARLRTTATISCVAATGKSTACHSSETTSKRRMTACSTKISDPRRTETTHVTNTDSDVGYTESLPDDGSELFNQKGDKVAISGRSRPFSGKLRTNLRREAKTANTADRNSRRVD